MGSAIALDNRTVAERLSEALRKAFGQDKSAVKRIGLPASRTRRWVYKDSGTIGAVEHCELLEGVARLEKEDGIKRLSDFQRWSLESIRAAHAGEPIPKMSPEVAAEFERDLPTLPAWEG